VDPFFSVKELYDNILPATRDDDLDSDSIYPEGGEHVFINNLGCLLLFATSYFCDAIDDQPTFDAVLNSQTSEDLLLLHRRIVDQYIDEAAPSTLDAIILIGFAIVKKLSPENFPPFDPETSSSSEILEYIQVFQ
jgi:hypothetical protein